MKDAVEDVVAKTAQPMHHPYASMNWIRFIGSLRCATRRHQYLSPLSGHPG